MEHPRKEVEINIKSASHFGDVLRRMRRICGVSQEAIAYDSNISPRTICRIECGNYNPSLDNVIKIIHVLGYTVYFLEKEFFPVNEYEKKVL